MWNNLLKLTLVSYVWKRYRRTLIALPVLLLYFWFVNLVHHDIIAYATLNKDTSWLGWSFLVKWLFILLGVVVFVLIHLKAKPEQSDKLISPLKHAFKESKSQQKATGKNLAEEGITETDAFERIRKKDKLRSKADIVIEKNQSKL